jgi:hypothetical protein
MVFACNSELEADIMVALLNYLQLESGSYPSDQVL